MWQKASRAAFAAAFVLASVATAIPHGDDESMDMDMHGMDMGDHGDMHASHPEQPPKQEASDNSPMSYFAYGKHSGTIIAHIALMVLAWCFILPVAVMFSVGRSRYALPSQFLFLVLNAFGMLVGIIYNSQTPDLYENNAHHKIGWIATWVMSAQVIMSLIFAYAGRGKHESSTYEGVAFLPVSTDEMAHSPTYPAGMRHEYRWSRDSGQGTECNSDSLHSRPGSPSCASPSDECDSLDKPEDDVLESPAAERRGWLQSTFVDRFLASRVPRMVSSRVLRVLNGIYLVIDRIILPFGFVAIATGGVAYGGIMRGGEVFNGLAHFIKGGIFFWYGILTLGRFLGCWADLGWAWNIKPSRAIVGWKAKVPTGEFTESFVIWLYGVTNVFLEHLSSWGGAWSATDLEHVSISIMFFGGGLCGMLIESQRVKSWLNSTVLRYPSHLGSHAQNDGAWRLPDTQGVSLNPMPPLIILLLGMMMGSHHQDSMVSTMIHKQWGNLFVGFALARGATYLLLYIKPPTSYLPSRPPTEIISAFCLIAGGLVFMLSTRNVVQSIEYYDLDAMFTFTVSMGFTAFIMACVILVVALKAWATKKESRPQLPPYQFPA